MASNNFWTTPTYAPMQQFRYDVETNLWKYKKENVFPSEAGSPPGVRLETSDLSNHISKELIKSVNLSDVAFGYDNDAANIGSSGPSIESQDPQMSELELQLYMVPDLLSTIPEIFNTYYLQDVRDLDDRSAIGGELSRILNKDRISLKPASRLLSNSTIIINIYSSTSDPRDTKRVTYSTSANAVKPTPLKKIIYYGVYPISYNLGNLDYSSSDVVVGNMKFYFYGFDIINGDEEPDNKELQNVIKSITGSEKHFAPIKDKLGSMGNF